ncbi:FAD-dependent oxidoreductase [Sporomusa acidovorans]|uniref:Fumarate reductase flavoprotein subunit n=1 Tax=Sporomusa acidovorans (strain ATCC 49682 / DSM 3132 / Mol) TaxID=1123286 RepID=A0ABZ3J0M5_SPOA4|nr:FAD-dependent oxidoreductase [Sporomusa acidovorans]OZC21338.1 fumarate reductase flavoprotein subunit precursor [Sporomusa acidovorans DSM 3132]SDE56962.1 Succinate dehydrogenase/fumarate reductase, flavoprotein subunit [Sporomusa acidovorans]
MTLKDKSRRRISRRDFFKGSALGVIGVASAGLLAGCGKQTTAGAKTNGQVPQGSPKYSFEVPPPPIPESDIKQTVTVDVVIIGAGPSGMSAAVSAVEAGAKVVVIAKTEKLSARGEHNFAINTRMMKEAGLTFDVAAAYKRMLQLHSHNVNEDLWWLFANKSGEAMDWVTDKALAAGLKPVLYAGWSKDPISGEYPGTHEFYGPNASGRGTTEIDIVAAFEAEAKKKGVEFYYNTRAEQLIKDGNGRVIGTVAKSKDGSYIKFVGNKGVILATGDYASDKEMMARYCPLGAQAHVVSAVTPGGMSSGDGHKMGLWAGGAMQKAEPHAAMIFTAAGPAPYFNLHVNKFAKRFANEDLPHTHSAVTILQQPDRLAYTIWDANFIEQLASTISTHSGTEWDYPHRVVGEKWEPDEALKGWENLIKAERLFKADTIEELAEKLQLPVDALKETIARYNKFAKAGNDEDYHKSADLLFPIEKPPFYGGQLRTVTLVTVGGLSVNTKLQVLDKDAKPVPGLYAVGTVSGDFFANIYTTHFPGWNLGRCFTWGYLAGKTVAAEKG